MDDPELGAIRSTSFQGGWVSTCFRVAPVEDTSRYYETMAFRHEYDPAEGIAWQSTALTRKGADRQHDLAVRWFSRSEKARPPVCDECEQWACTCDIDRDR